MSAPLVFAAGGVFVELREGPSGRWSAVLYREPGGWRPDRAWTFTRREDAEAVCVQWALDALALEPMTQG